jgi:Ca-activated chloride channel family protein
MIQACARNAMVARRPKRLRLLAFPLLCFVPYLNGQDRNSAIPTFKVDVITVFVNVSVADPLNRYVTGLKEQHFTVYEDNVKQSLMYFSQQSAPVSVGILFDISDSMASNLNIGKAKTQIFEFLKWGNPGDEYFLITFNEKVDLVQAFRDETAALQSKIYIQQTGGSTALYDAVYRGLTEVKKGRNEKKALILVTDGEDNTSRYTPAEIQELCKESNVQIYSIGLLGPEGYGASLTKRLSDVTGGRAFFPYNLDDVDYFIGLVHTELRNQYLLGYTPTNTAHDGKWRQIRVKLDKPRGLPKLSIRAREGYYAGKE